MIDRRCLLVGGGAAAAATGLPARVGAAADDGFASAALMADVARYAGFGDHRTGGPGDLATGRWVRERLGRAGFALSDLTVTVPFFDAAETRLQAGALTVAGIAQYPVTPTGPAGITVPLAIRYDAVDDAGLRGRIAVVPLPYARHSSALSPVIAPILTAVRQAGAVAAVLITTGPSGLPIALNTTLAPPFAGLPILLVGLAQAPALIAAARAAAAATLVIAGTSGSRTGMSVIARRAGPGPKVVVTTPLSGWFRCAGERGTGIAAWLAFAHWLPRAFPRHDLTFAGFVGHEFENAGSKRFLTDLAPPPADVRLWHHFGSGLATRDWHDAAPGQLLPLQSVDPQRYLLASPAFAASVATATRGMPGFEKVYPASRETAAGEATAILAAGYDRLLANFAGNRFHHTTGDLPDTVVAASLAATARALRSAMSTILSPA